MRRVLALFVYSNIFISFCAVAMAAHSYLLFQDALPPVRIVGFIFFATLTSYSFHWMLTDAHASETHRSIWLRKWSALHSLLLVAGALGVCWYGLQLLAHWPWLLTAAIITFLYSAPKLSYRGFRWLRKIAIGKTIFLALVWTFVTCALPILLTGESWTSELLLYFIGRFFFLYAICILFDLRDRAYDRSIGIRSLITWLDLSTIRRLYLASCVVSLVLTLWLLITLHDISAALWMQPQGYLLLVPVVICFFIYRLATRSDGDFLFYFWLDGLMALAPALGLLWVALTSATN